MAAHDSNLSYVPTWCAGCGDFGILNAWKKAMGLLNLDLEQTVLVAGIGCSKRRYYQNHEDVMLEKLSFRRSARTATLKKFNLPI